MFSETQSARSVSGGHAVPPATPRVLAAAQVDELVGSGSIDGGMCLGSPVLRLPCCDPHVDSPCRPPALAISDIPTTSSSDGSHLDHTRGPTNAVRWPAPARHEPGAPNAAVMPRRHSHTQSFLTVASASNLYVQSSVPSPTAAAAPHEHEQPRHSPPEHGSRSQPSWQLRVLRDVGRGAFGRAWLAEVLDGPAWFGDATEPALEPFIVAKVVDGAPAVADDAVPAGARSAALRRAQDEADIMCSARHPNLMPCVDFGTNADRTLTILMPYCASGDLTTVLVDLRANPSDVRACESRIGAIVAQLLCALSALHTGSRVVHRDVKPRNVFVKADGTVVLGDFGVACRIPEGSAQHAGCRFSGSPMYAAPEVFDQKPFDGRADVWSLGCLLYELLTHGDRAFAAADFAAVRARVCAGSYAPLEQHPVASRYDPALLALVRAMLTCDAAKRPTAAELLRGDELRGSVKKTLMRIEPPQRTGSVVAALSRLCAKSPAYAAFRAEALEAPSIDSATLPLEASAEEVGALIAADAQAAASIELLPPASRSLSWAAAFDASRPLLLDLPSAQSLAKPYVTGSTCHSIFDVRELRSTPTPKAATVDLSLV